MKIHEALEQFFDDFAEYGDPYTVAADSLGFSNFQYAEKLDKCGVKFTITHFIDLRDQENMEHVYVSDSNILVHKMYDRFQVVAQFSVKK